eukprot:scaffold2910_cov390-Prasinococcus_capsulatus_cf.AAC.2
MMVVAAGAPACWRPPRAAHRSRLRAPNKEGWRSKHELRAWGTAVDAAARPSSPRTPVRPSCSGLRGVHQATASSEPWANSRRPVLPGSGAAPKTARPPGEVILHAPAAAAAGSPPPRRRAGGAASAAPPTRAGLSSEVRAAAQEPARGGRARCARRAASLRAARPRPRSAKSLGNANLGGLGAQSRSPLWAPGCGSQPSRFGARARLRSSSETPNGLPKRVSLVDGWTGSPDDYSRRPPPRLVREQPPAPNPTGIPVGALASLAAARPSTATPRRRGPVYLRDGVQRLACQCLKWRSLSGCAGLMEWFRAGQEVRAALWEAASSRLRARMVARWH